MKNKLLLSTILGVAAWSLSSFATAGWVPGPCVTIGGPPPCIETEVNGNVYHFNGSGSNAGKWHGHPIAGDFEFTGNDVDLQCALDLNCTLRLSGQVKKCLDSNGAWRIGVKVTSSNVSGTFPCGLVSVSGFPWFSKDLDATPHCEFTDNCDDFILFDPSAASYAANFGSINVSALGITLVDHEHVHNVIFTPGSPASFYFDSYFYDCGEVAGCHINGELFLSNATSLYVK